MKLRTFVPLLAAAALIGGLFLLRDRPPESPSGLRVVVVGLDGTHFGLLSPLVEQGRVPNLTKFLERGTCGIMSSPVHEGYTSAALWTTMVTGVEPYRHGITDFVLPEPSTCAYVSATSGHRTAPALWNMLDDAGLRPCIVGLWATWPAEPTRGAIVSDHVTYSRMRLSKSFRTSSGEVVPYDYETATRNTHPPDLADRVDSAVYLPAEIERDLLLRFAPFTDAQLNAILQGNFSGNFNDVADPLQELKVATQSDRSYRDIGLDLNEELRPNLLWVYLEGIDALEHHFWPYHDPAFPYPLNEAHKRRFSGLLNAYVEFTDEMIREYLEMADEQTVVIVLSDHGYATIRDPGFSRQHWHDGNAILFAAGGPIHEKKVLDPGAATIYDVTPTILTLLGLPVADDMPGRVLTEIIDPEFLERHPIQRRPTYGTRAPIPGDMTDSKSSEELLARLEQLGYAVGKTNDPNQPIDMATWRMTPHIFGRLATACDVQTGRAAFVTDPPGGAKPGPGPMPRCAIFTDEDGVDHPVIVIQVESQAGRARVGFRFMDGRLGRATGDRVDLLEEPDERFGD